MAVRKDGERWVIEFRFRGVRIFRRLPAGRTKAEGQALESKLRSDIFNTVDLGRSPELPLRRIIEAWAKGKDDKTESHVKAVLAALPDDAALSEIQVVGDQLVAKWKDLAPGTINRRLSVLKAAAKHAKRKRWAARNYSSELELLPEPGYVRREVGPEMAQRLIQEASTPRAKALIAGAAFTGMRLSEVLRFNPERDIEGGAIRVRDMKGGGDRLVPILPQLKPHLSQFPMTSNWRNVYRGFEQARKRAGLTLRYHDLRHMAATAMVNAGIDLRTVADIMGHKSLQTTRRYTHPSLERKREALRAIPSGFQRKARKRTLKAA